MQDNESIKNELQTLIMLEQQQAGALHQLNNKATFPGGGGGFGGGGFMGGNMFSSLYGPSSYGAVGNSGQTLYDRAVNGVINSVNNVNASMRHAALAANLDSSSFIWRNQSKMSAEARELQASRFGEKMTGGAVSALSTGAGLLTSMAGFVPGLVGGAAVGVTAGIAADQLKQNFAYDQYLMQNSYRFINMYESNNKRGVGGFNRNERWGVANWLRNFNTEMKISDEDTMTILKGFTEGDLLREADNVDTFKKQMTSLTKTLKTMALTLNESYEEIADLMAEMKKKGIDTRNYQAYSSSAKITGGLIGAEASEVLQYQMNTASALTQGTSLSTDRMMKTVDSAQAYMGKLYDESLKNKDKDAKAADSYNRIVNRGGVDGATTDYLNLTSSIMRGDNITNGFASAFFDWDGTTWKFNRNKFNDYASGNYTMQQIAKDATANLNNNGMAANAAWLANGSYYLENEFSSVTDRAKFIKLLTTSARNGSPSASNFSDAEILSTVLGFANGQDSLFLDDFGNYVYNDGGEYYNKIKSAASAESFIQRANANRAGLGYTLKNWWGGVTDSVGDFFAPVGKGFSNISEWAQDLWYGKNYYDVKGLWNNIDFEKDLFTDDELTQKIKLLKDALSGMGVEAEKAANSSNKAAKILGNTLEYYQGILERRGSSGAANNGSGLHSNLGGGLTDYRSWKNDWDSEYGNGYGFLDSVSGIAGAARKGAYARDIAAYFKDVLKMDDIKVDGRMTLDQEKQIMNRAEAYLVNLGKGNSELDFEQNRMITNYRNYIKYVGGKDATIIKADGYTNVMDTDLFANRIKNGTNDLASKFVGMTAEERQKELRKAEKALDTAEAQLRKTENDWIPDSWQSGRTKSQQKMVNDLREQYNAITLADKIVGSDLTEIEGTAKMYGAFTRLIGGSEGMAKSAYDKIMNKTGDPDAAKEELKNFYIDEIFTGLGEKGNTNWVNSIVDLAQFKSDAMNSAHLLNTGLTTTDIGEAIDYWANKEGEEVKTGDKLTADKLSSLIDTFMNQLSGKGIMSDETRAQDEQKARDYIEDIAKMLRDYIYGKDGKRGYVDKTDVSELGLNMDRRNVDFNSYANKNGTTSSGDSSSTVTYMH